VTDAERPEDRAGHSDNEGLLEKAKDKVTDRDEGDSGEEYGPEHRSEGAPPPGEEPTTPGYNSPKTGPA